MIDRQVGWFRRRLDLPDRAIPPPGDGPHPRERLGCYRDGDLPAGATLAYTGAGLDPTREGQVGSALIASGRSLLAERVRDLLVALLFLRERRNGHDPGPLVLVGHGFDGVLLLAAAPLLPPEARL